MKQIPEMSDSAASVLGKEKARKFFELLEKAKSKIEKIYTSDHENPTTKVLAHKDNIGSISLVSNLSNEETGSSAFSFRSNSSVKENFQNFVFSIKKPITELEKNKNYINRKTMEEAQKVEETYNPPSYSHGCRMRK